MEQKKGTTTVGLVCKDGVVMGADRRASAGTLIVDKKAQKVNKITDYCAVTIAGTVSDAQLIIKLLKAEVNLKAVRTGRDVTIGEIANLLAGLLYSNIRRPSMMPGIAHFLLGGDNGKGAELYDLFPDGSLSRITDYVSSGSGSVIAYGVLESKYKEGIDVEEGVKLVKEALISAMHRDMATGNGIDVIVINKGRIDNVFSKELDVRL